MAGADLFTKLGEDAGGIDVQLSYKIVELFSEGLYSSPNKAIEELVANSFDAGARRVQVILSPNMHAQDASIIVADDGEGMDSEGLRQHWKIGVSAKRRLQVRPLDRQQIGKFGIGKLATYVLASRLTHVSKRGGKYYLTSMDYEAIDKRADREVEPKAPLRIPLRVLREGEAKDVLAGFVNLTQLEAAGLALFGKGAPESFTVAILGALKPKVHEIKPGLLEWVLRTALPLRPDFGIWLGGKKLVPSKEGKGLLKKWILGKDLAVLPKPAPSGITVSLDGKVPAKETKHFGLDVPQVGRVSGFAEVYENLLTGKSDEIGRSHGFFVYVFDRLVNVLDGHFGISPDELRHGTFGRFRCVVYMDGLDEELRSNREAISEGPVLAAAQDVLRAIFNSVRSTLEVHDRGTELGSQLVRKVAASPASLSRTPILALARAVIEGKATGNHLYLPDEDHPAERKAALEALEARAEEPETFVTGREIVFDGSSQAGLAQYDVASGGLRINGLHPFVATFHDDFASKGVGQPLELLAMGEVLIEAHLYAAGIRQEQIDEFLSLRDEFLRSLANESGRKSAVGVSLDLLEARNNPDALEEAVVAAFASLGFDAARIGGKGKPDGMATALLAADENGRTRQFKVSLEAKSKKKDEGTVAAATVNVSAIKRHRDSHKCQHAVVVGRSFPTQQGDEAALIQEIRADRADTKAKKDPKTITLITIDDLAELVRLRPRKQLGLVKLREWLEVCSSPEESRKWVEAVRQTKVKRPPYLKIVKMVEELQRKRAGAQVKYQGLAIALGHLTPPIEYSTDDELTEVCRGLAQMAPGALYAGPDAVSLETSANNVVEIIEGAMKEYDDE